jgi:hypothetical protein
VLELPASKPSITERITGITASWPIWRSPFGVLCRSFFAQFFTSETATSDIRLHQAMSGVLTVLLMPGLLMAGNGVSQLQRVELLARQLHASGMFEPVLADSASQLIAYSMLVVGFLTVLVWDALAFDRRDAMVLGPLPVRGSEIVPAKLTALGTLLVLVVGLVTAIPIVFFAWGTFWLFGPMTFTRYLAAYCTSTISASVFVFATIVLIRGAVALFVGAHLAHRIGAMLKFLIGGAVLTFLFVAITAGSRRATLIFLVGANPEWMPAGWFVALFEVIRGSGEPALVAPSTRAALATAVAAAGAVAVSVAGFRHHSQLALAPSSSAGLFASARLGRTIARLITRGDRVAQATADFILLTLVRNRPQQELIAINAGLGTAIVIAALARGAQDLASLTRPRTAVLWIPFVLAYALTIGLRAAFFVPSELRGSWTFRVISPKSASAYWSAVRASMAAVVLPPTTFIATAIFVPLLGWRSAALHTFSVCVVAAFLIEIVALTIRFVPFTEPYRPGHADLKSLWWLYVLGLVGFAYVPARIALSSLDTPAPLLWMTASVLVATAAVDVIARGRTHRCSTVSLADDVDETFDVTVLDLATPVKVIGQNSR